MKSKMVFLNFQIFSDVDIDMLTCCYGIEGAITSQ